MAGIAVPATLRPALAAVAKHHFWILAALVPVILLPLLFVGGAGLRSRIATQKKQIEAKLRQAQDVTRLQPHPNEEWQKVIDADAKAVDRETLEEWCRFWHGQRTFRTWPAELDEPFLGEVAKLEPGGQLTRPALVRYQNMAPQLARGLPARMGVKDAMTEAGAGGGPMTDAQRSPAKGLPPALAWAPESQRRLYQSFVWLRSPNTTQVLLAQEELWVYGLFCDLIRNFVKSAGTTGAHDSPLTLVEELVVGFPAGVSPGKDSREQARIYLPKAADGPGPEAMLSMDAPPGAEASGPAPWHPRFGGGGGRDMTRLEAPGGGGAAAGPTEDDYRGWVYVDFTGKPLSVMDLAAEDRQAARMVHLMPFVLRVVVGQEHLDRLLATLAASAIPIDVRQVRVNPGAGARGAEGGGFGDPSMSAAMSRADGVDGRPGDLLVELRGTVALATPPPAGAAAPAEASP